MSLHVVERGSGEPLLLVHGLGSYWGVWTPVLDRLAAGHRVLAVDLPGFGQSPPLPADVEPTPAALTDAVVRCLGDAGLDTVHVVGNSLGGWLALELAKSGRARSVTALSPAGLWHQGNPRLAVAELRLSSWVARRFRPLVGPVLGNPLARTVGLATIFARPWRVSAQEARAQAEAFAAAVAFDAVLEATRERRFLGGQGIDVPVTVAFGSSDRLLVPWQNDARDQLPAHTRWLPLPGCGHLPMYDDPELVVRTVRETVAAAG